MTRKEENLHQSHSVEEAQGNNQLKKEIEERIQQKIGADRAPINGA